jgi:ligand-binding SRPBCC domain-containing protein
VTNAWKLERTQLVRRSPEDTFAFFADPWNLEAITPPWLRFRITDAEAPLHQGALLAYRLRLFGLPIRWRTEIARWEPPRTFTDIQIRGPYALWEHTHTFAAVPGGTEVHDLVRYRIPLGPLGAASRHVFVRRWLDAIFDYRATRLREVLEEGAGPDASPETPGRPRGSH